MTRFHADVAALQETQLKSKCSEEISKCDVTWFSIGESSYEQDSLSVKNGMRIIADLRMFLKRIISFQSFLNIRL